MFAFQKPYMSEKSIFNEKKSKCKNLDEPNIESEIQLASQKKIQM